MNVLLWLPGAVVLALVALLVSVAPASQLVVTEPAVVPQEKAVTILAFGDLMLDRAVREKIEVAGAAYPFEKIKHLFEGYDIVVANAEGVFTNNNSISVVDHNILRFTFDPGTLPTLKSIGFTVFSQANNHALDFGTEGLAYSKQKIAENGILSFGDPLNMDPGPLYVQVGDETIAFVGYHQLFTSDASTTVAAIAKAREQQAFVIVYPHWGEEYVLGTTTLQTKLAHKFIDAGADVLIGAHPHVVEPIEQYNGKVIFYSLGNFVFDQKWNDDVRHGLAVGISLTKKEVTYTVMPYTIVDLQPTPTGEKNIFVLQR